MPADARDSRTARIVAVLGHELRNPLAASVARVTAAAEMTDPSDPRHPFLRRALDDLARVSDLLDRYLEFGRSGSVHGEAVEVDVLVRRLAARHPCRVLVGPADPRGLARADAVLLERALENLLDNAARAGAKEVRISTRLDAGRVVIDVCDDGPGIPQELGERIFEPFVSGGGGSGLGLALVAEVLESHGGRIEALPSEAGARFRLTLPAVQAPPGRTLQSGA